jgi:hypothetical protein
MTANTTPHESSTTQGAGADLGATAAEAGQEVKQQVVDLGQQVRQQATDQIVAQKDRAAEALETVALLLHQAGEHAQQQDKAAIAQYVDKAADQVETWSTALREQDASQLVETTQQFARRQPLAFLGGALALGFAGVRFFRSSASQAQPTEQTPATGQTGTSTDDDMGVVNGDAVDRAADLNVGDRPLDVGLSLPDDWASDLDGERTDFTEATAAGDLPGETPVLEDLADEALIDDAYGASDPETR